MTRIIIITLLILLFCSVGIGSAATYYVDTDSIGGAASDANNGTIGYPYKTIDYVNGVLVAGDTVYIRAGTYSADWYEHIKPDNSGSSGNYITYQNYNDELVTMSGGGPRQGDLSNRAYIKIDGIHFYDTGYSWILFNATTHSIIQNCNFLDSNAGSGIVLLSNSNYNQFINNTFPDAPVTAGVASRPVNFFKTTSGAHNLWENNTFGNCSHVAVEFENAASMYNVLRNNTITNHFHTGFNFNLGANWNLVENNTFYDMGESYLDDPTPAADRVSNPGIQCANANYIIVRKNVFDNCGPAIDGSPEVTNGGNRRIYSNTFNGSYSTIQIRISLGQSSLNNHVINNIITGTLHSGSSTNEDGWGLYGSSTGDISGIYASNNFYDNYGEDVKYDGTIGLANLSTVFSSQWFDNVQSNPLYTDSANRDFTLQSTSPMINAGTHLTTVTSSTNTGQTAFTVSDASYFYDGWNLEGEVGDTIKTESGGETVIQSIDYTTNTLTVSPAIDIVLNEGLSLTYTGTAPDIGAFEATASTATVKNTSGVWNFWTYENIPELHAGVNDESVLGYSGDIYTFYEPFYQNKTTDTFYFNETVHLKSNVDANPAYFKWAGTNIIDDSNVTGWNTTSGAAATTYDSTIAYMYGENTSTGDITDSKFSNLGYFAWMKYGLFLDGYSGVTINNNTFSNNRDGFVMSMSDSNTITNNTLYSNTYGIHFSTCNNNDISDNTVYSNSKHGIRLFTSSNNTLTDNNVSDTSGGYYDYSFESNAENNTVTLSTKSSEYFSVDNTINSILLSGTPSYTVGYPLTATVLQDNAATGAENANVTVTSGTVDYVHVTSGLSATTNYSMFYSLNDTTVETQITDGSGAANFTTNLTAATYYIDETVQPTNLANFTFGTISVSPATVVLGSSSTVSLNITDADGTISNAIVKILGVNYTMSQSGIAWSYTYTDTDTVEKHYITNVYAQDSGGAWNSTTSALYIDVLTASTGGGGGGSSTPEEEEDPTQYAPTSIPSIDTANITLQPVTYASEVESYLMGEDISLFRVNFGTDQPVFTKRVFNTDISECSAPNGSIVSECTVSNGYITVRISPVLDGIYSSYDSYVILTYTDGINYHAPVKVSVFDIMGSVGGGSIKVSGLPSFIFAYDDSGQNVTGLTLWFTLAILLGAAYFMIRREW